MRTVVFKLRLFLFLFSLNAIPSQSAVSSIDLGSEWLKVAVVNLKPGQSPISIAINEMSKRKSPALVAFQTGTRLLGEEAAGITARYPQKVYSQLRDMIGKPYDYVKAFLDSMYLSFDVVEDFRGGPGFKIEENGSGNVSVYSAEELLAMVLSYAANLAEFHSKAAVKDAVISVPPYFGQAERRGLLQAAHMAGINVLSLINEHSGAALQYGIDKDFSNGSRYVVFYDMGASSTYAALVYYSAYNAKEFGKTVSVNQFQVKDVRWDPELGGQNMELRLVEFFADEFNKQVGNGVDVRKSPKAMAKLKKQVKRTKEILSANTVAPISVESLYDDQDFRSTISRDKFEELCEDLWDRSLLPLKEVLKHSGLKMDEIHAVELIGGATRVPKLQDIHHVVERRLSCLKSQAEMGGEYSTSVGETNDLHLADALAKLQEFLGRNGLDKHLDADEAIVLGGALCAANLSDGIKLNRKIGIFDGSSFGFVVELDGPDLAKDESAWQSLVPRMKRLPSKMFRSIVHNKDFEVSLAYETEELLPPGVTSAAFARYAVTGLADASEKYSCQNLSAPIKANLHFSLSRSGILSLDRAYATVEISEWVEMPKRNLTVENTTNVSQNISVETGGNNASEESNKNLNSDGEIGNSSDSTVEEPSTIDLPTEKTLKKQTFRVPLKIVEKTVGPGMPLSKESLDEAKRRLDALNKKDAERRRTAELKNNLEGYIYSTKDQLESSEEFEKIFTSEEQKSVIEKLDEVQEWLYTDGEDATANEFQERLDSLKAIGDPLFFRYEGNVLDQKAAPSEMYKELTARPAAADRARKYLSELQQIVQEWETNKPWLPRDEIDEVLKDADKLKTWLNEKETEQSKTPGFSKPVFTSVDVFSKMFILEDKVASINRIPKPKPKVEKPKKSETKMKAKSETDNSGENPGSSNSASEQRPETGKSTTGSDSSTNESVNKEPEVHDEL